jgi:hypothetical protein
MLVEAMGSLMDRRWDERMVVVLEGELELELVEVLATELEYMLVHVLVYW